MNEQDRALYRQRYVERLHAYGRSPQALGWTDGRQKTRFAALTSFVPLSAIASVLDVGCGFGDLENFLRERGYRGTYTGIDLVPELIDVAKAAQPELDLRACDVAEFSDNRQFDLIVASGIFNAPLRYEDPWQNITSTLQRMFDWCRIAAAADFLTSYVDFIRDEVQYTAPEDVFRFGKSLTLRVALRHDYLPFEFATCYYKNDRIVEQNQFMAV